MDIWLVRVEWHGNYIDGKVNTASGHEDVCGGDYIGGGM